MNKIIVIIMLFVSATIFAQGNYEKAMKNAFDLWEQGKESEASDNFERIASAEKNNWLPNYYVALINTTAAFQTRDKNKIDVLLTKAQKVLDIELEKAPDNPELMVMQAMIYTAWITYDPMTNGMKLSGKVMEIYGKAEKIAPENPRVVFGKAEFEIGGAKYFGTDIKPICAQIDKSIILFANFKAESPFHPKWGLDRALEMQKNCK